MKKYGNFLDGEHPGYWREGEGAGEWPWEMKGSGVWYALVVVEGGKMVRYGFTSAQRERLIGALEASVGEERQLIGVWTGEHRTDLFVLDAEEAVVKLRGTKRREPVEPAKAPVTRTIGRHRGNPSKSEVVAFWKGEEPRASYRELARRLGGVSISTAFALGGGGR